MRIHTAFVTALAIASLPLWHGGVAAAEELLKVPRSILPGLGSGRDPRVMVDVTRAPWRALGRVQAEGTRRQEGAEIWCTGALIGPRTVLTSARCLVSTSTRRFLQPSSIHFVLGYDRGTQAGHSRATALAIGPGFAPGGPLGADWALLTLEVPLGTPDRVLRLAPEPPAPDQLMALAGYQQDRKEVLLAHLYCRVMGPIRDSAGLALLHHTCAATAGANGAPLLARTPGGEWVVAGVAARPFVDRAEAGGRVSFVGAAGGLAVPAAAIDPAVALVPR